MKTGGRFVLVIISLAAASALARTEVVNEKISMDGAKEVSLKVDLGAGEFYIKPADIVEAAVVDIEYNPKRIEYEINFETDRTTRFIDFNNEHRSHSNIDTDDNVWEVQLSTKYPMTMDFDLGACKIDFDLGGLSVKELMLDVGAASAEISFSEPNPEKMSELNIDAGASSVTMKTIGNANFENFDFSGGAGSFDLDFRGEYHGESHIRIEIGMGSADITLPEGIPYSIDYDDDGFFSSVDVHQASSSRKRGVVRESPDFDEAETRIIVEIEVGMGSVDIFWK